MAELLLRPLLARAPELVPPRRWRVILLPALLAVMGMLIALAAVIAGQDARRAREYLQTAFDQTYWENELAQAKLAGKPEKAIADLEKTASRFRGGGLIS